MESFPNFFGKLYMSQQDKRETDLEYFVEEELPRSRRRRSSEERPKIRKFEISQVKFNEPCVVQRQSEVDRIEEEER